MNIRTLMADEIECRVQTVKENGCSVLLYKDARCDMRILDEVFGPLGWQRNHEIINGNLFCNVSVWDEDKKQWITKQDVGTESFTEKEKGQASDSFKRACFNLGIGRELYTAPFIWITLNSNDISKYNNKISVKTKFYVSKIQYNDKKEIVALEIKDDKSKVRYTLGQKVGAIEEETKKPERDSKGQKQSTSNSKTSNCADCGAEIKPAVETYSKQYYGKGLCMDCQKKNVKQG